MRNNKIVIASVFMSCLLFLMAMTVQSNQKHLIYGIKFSELTPPAQKQVQCLAENILLEAGHESREGQIAVGMVTVNRVVSGKYADDICDVVKQKIIHPSGKVVCQFSWVCEPFFTSKLLTLKHTSLYNDILDLSVEIFLNYDKLVDVTKGATYYHADYVNPGWKLPKTTVIGRHIFYMKPGDLDNKKEFSGI
jgi:spore germination cell wall hydrolase CwlJ-like protein